jgi:hypothetical protein
VEEKAKKKKEDFSHEKVMTENKKKGTQAIPTGKNRQLLNWHLPM